MWKKISMKFGISVQSVANNCIFNGPVSQIRIKSNTRLDLNIILVETCTHMIWNWSRFILDRRAKYRLRYLFIDVIIWTIH